MIIRHKYIKDKKIFIQKIEGTWSNDTYIAYHDYMDKTFDWSDLEFVFADLRGVKAKVSIDELKKLVYLRKATSTAVYRNVILVDSPLLIAFVSLYQKLLMKQGFGSKLFSTLEGVSEGLEFRLNPEELTQYLSECTDVETMKEVQI